MFPLRGRQSPSEHDNKTLNNLTSLLIPKTNEVLKPGFHGTEMTFNTSGPEEDVLRNGE